ncbi:flagellar filament capping protein FliD [Marinococcus luteus]|uniref:flagellar filament capping protein FliD n=1 Tax=Marinococcus luteus TaxID=1122204 RepID=UPI002ACC7130|nr:flagellar filament capping protein FliD [Marinococcus luteus]MDZ5784124.1 flagellar filament capping protein FliD [Marinococcus luteus]
MRVSGFASGMDIDQTVKDLMRAERQPINKLNQQKQTLEWQTEMYQDVNKQFFDFRNTIFDSIMKKSSMTDRSATSTNDSRVSATASADAGNATYSISEVKQLAKSASQSSSERATGTDFSATEAVGSQTFADGKEPKWSEGVIQSKTVNGDGGTSYSVEGSNLKESTDDMIVKVSGKQYEVVTGTDPLESGQVRATVNGDQIDLEFDSAVTSGKSINVQYAAENETKTVEAAAPTSSFSLGKGAINPGNLNISVNGGGALTIVTDPDQELAAGEAYVDTKTGRVTLGEAATGTIEATFTQQYSTNTITTFDKNGNEQKNKFTFTSAQSMNNIMSAISSSGAGVSAFYDEHSGKAALTRSETGDFNKDGDEMLFSGDFFNNTLGLNNVEGESNQGEQNAVFTMNGLETERAKNTFDVNGMSITLKETFTEAEGAVTLGSDTNTDGVMETIQGFVEEYNKIVEDVNGKLNEKVNRDFKPLSDEQKEEMSEKEIEMWEEKARSGLLRSDSSISNVMNNMRSLLYEEVDGTDSAYNTLYSIGITTSSSYTDNGKLEIDEDQLRQAIEDDSEGVYQLFAASGSTTETQGLARRMRETLDNGVSALAERAGGYKGKLLPHQFTLGRNLENIDDRIAQFEDRMVSVENRYYRQFTAMEQAMSQANSQSNYLTQFMNGGQ